MIELLRKLITVGTLGLGAVLGSFHTLITPQWTLVATGDIMPGRSVNYQMTKRGDFLWPIRDIAPLLSSADLTLINLESPLAPNCPLTNSGMTFCANPKFAEALAYAGVDVVNLANNHILNQGWTGITQTETALENRGIQTTGTTMQGSCANQTYFCSKKTITTVKGITVGFVGYTIVGKKTDEEALGADIEELNNDVDVLVASFHWGAEYTRTPVGAPDDPRVVARMAVDHGADAVVGNHPHWIQGMEYYNGVPIFYALGNTIFDQEWSRETKQGIIAELRFKGKIVENVIIHPLRISDYGHAALLDGAEKKGVLDVFQEASNIL